MGQITGTAGNDPALIGGIGADTIAGLAGDDFLDGGDGDDVLVGGQGLDGLRGGTGSDVFVLLQGDNSIFGSVADFISDWEVADRIATPLGAPGLKYAEVANAGSFVLALSVANSIIASGSADVVAVKGPGDVFVFFDSLNDNGGADDAVALLGRSLADVSAANFIAIPAGLLPPATTLTGSAGADVIIGTPGPDLLDALSGDDLLRGGDGDDTLLGGDGNDTLSGAGGRDQIDGGAGVDTLTFDAAPSGVIVSLGTTAFQTIGGGEDADIIVGVENLIGSAFSDALYGGQGASIVDGGSGNDFIDGGAGDDTLSGGLGSDNMFGGLGDDSLSGDAGDDALRSEGGGRDTLLGGLGNDILGQLGQGSGLLIGGVGDDDLSANLGGLDMSATVTLDGGDGNDRISLDAYAGLLTVTVLGGAGADSISTLSQIAGSIDGGSGDDVITLFRSPRLPTVTLGTGADTIRLILDPALTSSVQPGLLTVADFNALEDVVTGDLSGLLSNWNGQNPFSSGHLALLQSGSDTLLRVDRDGGGDAFVDFIRFNGLTSVQAATASLFGYRADGGQPLPPPSPPPPPPGPGGGGTPPSGTPGDDSVLLGDGAQTYDGGAGADTIDGGAGDDDLSGGTGDDRVTGGVGADTLTGGSGANYLHAGDGDDVIFGGPDFDDSHGNIGNDTVHGGGFDDWVVGGQGNDMLFGDDGGDLCYGQLGSDTIDGGAGGDAVVGGQANDLLNGGAGDDYITGDRGDDTVTGGLGADTFHTNNVQGLDRVTDFSQAQGDKVLVDVGSAYTLSQVGADTVIDMGGGNQMILVGVQLSSLTTGWITGG